MMRRALWIGIVLGAAGCAAPPASRPADSEGWGERLYATRCATCHDSEGGDGPALTPELLASYRRARPLFDYTRMAMPYDAPGSLSEAQYLEATAYLLRSRGLLSAGATLDSAVLDTLRLAR